MASSGSQLEPHRHLMTFQPAPRKSASSSCTILPLPRTGPSRRCRLQLMTKMRLSSFSRPASEIAPSDSGLVHLAVAAERPDLAPARVGEAAALEVAQEARLIDRHQRPEAHRHRGELPEIRHQPGMGIGGKPLAADFLAEVDELILAQPPFEEGAGIDAGRRMALEIDEIAAVRVVRRRARNA